MLHQSYRFSIILILWHISCQFVTAQQASLFSKFIPSHLDTVQFNPDAFAIGDVNGDGYEDLVLRQSNKKPIVVYFNRYPENQTDKQGIGEWGFDIDSLSTDQNYTVIPRDSINLIVGSVGPIHIMDGKNVGTNEIYFHHNLIDRATNAFKFDANSESINNKFIVTGNPAGFNYSRFSSNYWAYGDFNKDGLLDAVQGLQTTKAATNFLLYNVFAQNNSTFTRNTTSDIVINNSRTIGLYSYDFNKDSYTDIWEVTADNVFTNSPDFLYVGNGVDFSWNNTSVLNSQSTSNGAAIGDYDNDGDLDIYQLFSGGLVANVLYRNNGDFSFEKISNNLTRDLLDSRSAMWGDFNNDGYLDLVIAEYNGSGNSGAYPNLFENNGPDDNGIYTFTKRIISRLSELNSLGNWNHVSFVDYDLDGDLDILLIGKQATSPVQIFRNKLIQADSIAVTEKNWIGFDLTSSNSFTKLAINAKIKVVATINGKQETIYRELQPFHGYLAQQSRLIHVGLGNATSAQVTITWPSGLNQNTFYALNTLNKYYSITEPTASRLSFKTAQPFSISANLEESRTDTIYYQNIGGSSLSISAVETSKSYYSIKNFSKSLNPDSTGFIVLETFSTNSSLLGNHVDTLILKSNNLSGNSYFILNTSFNSRPARFTKITTELNAPFLSTFDGYQQAWIGNFNGDSEEDVYIRRLQSSFQLFFRSDTNFINSTTSTPVTTGINTRHVAIGDVNHDGVHDIAVFNEGTSNQLFVSNGIGGYELQSISAFNTPRISKYGQLHDIDGNGFLDLIIANSSNQANQIILNYGATYYGSVSKSGDEFTTQTGYTSFLTVFDLDFDGFDDIITADANNSNGNKIRFFKQTSPLVFKQTAVPNLTDLSIQARGILFFDKDNDGDFDILIVNSISTESTILLENVNGSYSKVNESLFQGLEMSPGDAVLTDFNMDGYLDLFFAETDFTKPNILLQSAGGVDFVKISTGEIIQNNANSSTGVTMFDYNNDAKPDFLISNYFGLTELYRNEINDYNFIGIKPWATYANGNESIRPGTMVELRASIFGVENKMTRIVGRQSLFSETFQSVWFGLGDATIANYKITVPGLDKTITGTLSELNAYQDVSITEVSLEDDESFVDKPKEFTISEPFPNPFNPSTQLNFGLPQNGTIILTIYDIMGRKVQQNRTSYSAGYHTLSIQLNHYSSGIYFIQVQFGQKLFIKKAVLMK